MKRKVALFLTPVVFLVLIFGFTLLNILTPDRGFSESENRYLQKRPAFSLKALFNGTFSRETEDYITDQFPGRDGFIGVKTQTEYLVGKRDTNGVYFGRDGYLIEKHDRLDEEQVSKNIQRTAAFVNRTAQELGEDHVRVMIAPTAGEILREKLPAFAVEFSQPELLEEIRRQIPERCWVPLLPVFEEANADGAQLYYKTDHHWTTDAAFLAYQAWQSSMGFEKSEADRYDTAIVTEDFFGTIYSKARLFSTRPDSIWAYYSKEEKPYQVEFDLGKSGLDGLYDESFLQKKDKYSYFLGGNHAVTTVTGPNQNGKTLLLVKDSYAHCMVPFLADEFERICMVDLRYYNGSLKEFQQQQGVTDVLVLYNAVTFSEDLGVLKMNS